jgi:hypothetical protein
MSLSYLRSLNTICFFVTFSQFLQQVFIRQLELEVESLKVKKTRKVKSVKKLVPSSKNIRLNTAYTEDSEYNYADDAEIDNIKSFVGGEEAEGAGELGSWGFDQRVALNSETDDIVSSGLPNNERPDSRAFGRPDSRANSRKESCSFDSSNANRAAPPVNPTGLSGFRTAAANGKEEEEEDYGNEEFAVDVFDK